MKSQVVEDGLEERVFEVEIVRRAKTTPGLFFRRHCYFISVKVLQPVVKDKDAEYKIEVTQDAYNRFREGIRTQMLLYSSDGVNYHP